VTVVGVNIAAMENLVEDDNGAGLDSVAGADAVESGGG
jgi:hypothetical protein